MLEPASHRNTGIDNALRTFGARNKKKGLTNVSPFDNSRSGGG